MLFISLICKPFWSNPQSRYSDPRSLQTYFSVRKSVLVHLWRIFSFLKTTIRLFTMSNCYFKSLTGLYSSLVFQPCRPLLLQSNCYLPKLLFEKAYSQPLRKTKQEKVLALCFEWHKA